MLETRIRRRQSTSVIEPADAPESGDSERARNETLPQEDMACLLDFAQTIRGVKPGLADNGIKTKIDETQEFRDVHEELAKSKADIESLISAIPVAVYRASPDRTLTTAFMSERWREWTDNAASEFCLSPETWPKSIHPDDCGRVVEAFNEACRKKSEYTLEYRIVHRGTGVVLNVRDHGLPLLDKNGGIASIHGVVMDVTHRSRARGEVRDLLARQTAVARLAATLSESHDPSRIYRIIYDAISAVIKTDAFIISFYDSRTALISIGYAVGENGEIPAGSIPPIPLGKYWRAARSYVIRTGQPLYVPDYTQTMEGAARENGFKGDHGADTGPITPDVRIESANSAVFVPMRFRGRTAGVIQVQSRQIDAYTSEDVDLLVALANVAAVAIQNVQLLRRIQHELTERKRAEAPINRTSIPPQGPGPRSQDRIAAHPVAVAQAADS